MSQLRKMILISLSMDQPRVASDVPSKSPKRAFALFRLMTVLATLLAFSTLGFSQPAPPDQRDRDAARSFLQSVGATIYKLAWPTATYQRIDFDGFQRVDD